MLDAFRSADLDFGDRNKLAHFLAGSLAAAPQITGVLVADAKGDALRIGRTSFDDIERDWLTVNADEQLKRIAEQTRMSKEAYWGPPI